MPTALSDRLWIVTSARLTWFWRHRTNGRVNFIINADGSPTKFFEERMLKLGVVQSPDLELTKAIVCSFGYLVTMLSVGFLRRLNGCRFDALG